MKRLHAIVDANNFAYRADVVTELYTTTGKRTSAIYGVLQMLYALFDQLESLYHESHLVDIICTWDYGHSKRRTELYPEYKASRKPDNLTDEERELQRVQRQAFYDQNNILHDFLPHLGVRSMRVSGWEGDDLVWAVVQQVESNHDLPLTDDDLFVMISTDEDYHQMIGPKVHLFSPIKKILYTPENYKQLKGFPLSGFLTYKILVGDSSDGIPGVHGIGAKTATDLINKYGDMRGILSHPDELKKSKRTAAIFTVENLSVLNRNNKLINLRAYVDTSDVRDYVFKTLTCPMMADMSYVKSFMVRYQFSNMLSTLQQWMAPFTSEAVFDYNCHLTSKQSL